MTVSFVDLHSEVSKLKGDTILVREHELAQNLPSVALCALGGFPFLDTALRRPKDPPPPLRWVDLEVTPEKLREHFLNALGLSAVLTFMNKKERSLHYLGQLCVDHDDAWAYHWITATIVLARHEPAVHLAFARDTRFKLSWVVEPHFTGKVFAASAGIHEWLKFTRKWNDQSFDAHTRKAMKECYELLSGILPPTSPPRYEATA